MGAFAVDVRLDVAKLDDLKRNAALKIVDAAAREIAFEVLRRAMIYLEHLVYTRPNPQVGPDSKAKEPTGALWNSGYVRTFTGQLPPGCPDEASALSAAQSRNPDVTFGQAPPGPARLGMAQVLFATEYAIYVEMGTILGMIARPYLTPAADEVQTFAEKFVMAKLKLAGFSTL